MRVPRLRFTGPWLFPWRHGPKGMARCRGCEMLPTVMSHVDGQQEAAELAGIGEERLRDAEVDELLTESLKLVQVMTRCQFVVGQHPGCRASGGASEPGRNP